MFVGSFSQDERSGHGHLFLPNGDRYTGNFDSGKFNGIGEWYDGSNGKMYKGHFKDDLFHGIGTTFNQDGSIDQQGTWQND